MVLAGFFVIHTGYHVSASGSQPVNGFLWSDMPDQSNQDITCSNDNCGRGFGWVSLIGGGQIGGNALYQVNLDLSTGKMSGYAWSEYGGWVDFNPTSGYPTGNGTDPINAHGAQVNLACLQAAGTNCAVTGWIRFVAGQSGTSLGGWDGWVSLSGTAPSQYPNPPHKLYGVVLNAATGDFSGMAWGSSDAGWIDFSHAKTNKMSPVTPTTLCLDPAASNYNQAAPCTCLGTGPYVGHAYTYNYVAPYCYYPMVSGTPTLQGATPSQYTGTPTLGTPAPQYTGTPTLGQPTNPYSGTYTGTLPAPQYNGAPTPNGQSTPNPSGPICVPQTVYPPQCSGMTPPTPTGVCEIPAASNYTAHPTANQVSDPSVCTSTCTVPKTGTIITYPYGSNPPAACGIIPPPGTTNICEDSAASNYTAGPYTSNEVSDPAMCRYNVCEIPKDSHGSVASNYVSHPTSQDVSDPSVCTFIGCPDPTATNYDNGSFNGHTYTVIDTQPTSSCIYSGPGNGGNGSTVPINPIYKEN